MDYIIVVNKPKKVCKAMALRYKDNVVIEPDVTIFPTKPLVTKQDKSNGKKKFTCHSWILCAHSPTLQNLIIDHKKHRENVKTREKTEEEDKPKEIEGTPETKEKNGEDKPKKIEGTELTKEENGEEENTEDFEGTDGTREKSREGKTKKNGETNKTKKNLLPATNHPLMQGLSNADEDKTKKIGETGKTKKKSLLPCTNHPILHGLSNGVEDNIKKKGETDEMKRKNGEEDTLKIYIPELHQDMMITVLRYMYGDQCLFRRADAAEIVATAVFLQMEDLEKACLQAFLDDMQIQFRSVFDYVRIPVHEDIMYERLHAECRSIMKLNFVELYLDEAFYLVHFETMLQVINVARLASVSIEDIKSAIRDWCQRKAAKKTMTKLELDSPSELFVDCSEAQLVVHELEVNYSENVYHRLPWLIEGEDVEEDVAKTLSLFATQVMHMPPSVHVGNDEEEAKRSPSYEMQENHLTPSVHADDDEEEDEIIVI